MLSKIRRRAEEEQGFTLIELLVVILIIGILAAIAIPSFINQRGKAQDATAKADARTAQTAMETYFTDNQDYNTTAAGLVGIEPALSNANNLAVTPGATSYTVSVDSKAGAQGGGTFSISRASDGTVTRTCTNANKGGCKAGGVW
jgi:type IV pilus assembly protein PilA